VEAEIAGNFAPISTIIMRGRLNGSVEKEGWGKERRRKKEKKKKNLAASMTRF
jgi:hypothetical protein